MDPTLIPDYLQSIDLRRREEIRRVYFANSIGSRAGCFIITNQRLVMIWDRLVVRGLLGMKVKKVPPRIVWKADLNEIIDINIRNDSSTTCPMTPGCLFLNFSTYEYKRGIDFCDFLDIDLETGAIGTNDKAREAREFILDVIDEIQTQEQGNNKAIDIHIIMDFSNVQELLKNGGITLRSIKCPSCGASLSLPEKGKITNCQYCNCQINAIDIFEKVRRFVEEI